MANMYKVLVPHDFSDVADSAISHAATVAKSFKGEVVLLHVISSEKARSEAETRLTELTKNASNTHSVLVSFEIRKGSIFDRIPEVGEEIGAMLVVMGTHGIKGIQHLTGSYALKVIGHSKLPFIVNQGNKSKGSIKDLVLPIKFSQETKSKLSITASIARHFDATIHIFISNENDEFIATKVKRELTFAKQYFTERKVKYEVEIAPEHGNFIPQLLDYSSDIDADMIAIVNASGDGGFLPDLFKGSGEIEVLNNKFQIPVIVMNPSQIFVPEHFG
ncbi:MAG: nucleotide-binding universal stress UspA family protein [Vicingaceae bacterium]|jgi:nucleotide-binding universal stress UspA family protein|tara:strand:- start:5445 stop:6272 length:828 start_codon:yes stop_codon:yes gene_type:complete